MIVTIFDCIRKFGSYEGQTITVPGRIMSKDDADNATCIGIEDNQGSIKVFIFPNSISENDYNAIKLHDIGEAVFVRGKPFLTDDGAIAINGERFIVAGQHSIKAEPPISGGMLSQEETDALIGALDRNEDATDDSDVSHELTKNVYISGTLLNLLNEYDLLSTEDQIIFNAIKDKIIV